MALAARNKEHLLDLHKQLNRAEIPHALVVEDDGEPTAIGCEITHDRKLLRSVLGALPLAHRWGECTNCERVREPFLKRIREQQTMIAQLRRPWWRRVRDFFAKEVTTPAKI